MPRHYDESQPHVTHATAANTSKNTRRQVEDQRRMEFRRAIESYSEQRQLAQELSDYFDLGQANTVWQQPAEDARRNARQAG